MTKKGSSPTVTVGARVPVEVAEELKREAFDRHLEPGGLLALILKRRYATELAIEQVAPIVE